MERESCESEQDPTSPLPGRPTHDWQLSANSASRDSGLTMSNPQLYDDELSCMVDDQRTLERDPDQNLAPDTRSGKPVASTAQAGGVTSALHKSTTISDDSVLGSPNEFSAENSEQDFEDVILRRHTVAPLRLHSLESESDSQGLASAFYEQRPKSFDMVTDDVPSDFVARNGSTQSEEQPVVIVAETKGEESRRTLERKNAVDELTPVNSWRRKQGAADRDKDVLIRDRIQRSPLPSDVRSPKATGLDVAEMAKKTGGRRSVDSASGNKATEPSYEEALLHKELLRNDLSELDRQEIKTSLARKIYQKSLVMYASQNSPERPSSSKSMSKTSLPKIVVPAEPQIRSSSYPDRVPRRSVDGVSHGSPKLPISPREGKCSPTRSGGLTVIVSPATQRRVVVHDKQQQPVHKSVVSPLPEGRRRFQRKHLTVVDISSSSSDRSLSPHQVPWRSGSKRRAVRRRASDRYRHRNSDPKVDGNGTTSKWGGKGVNRSKSDASDVMARVSRFRADRSYPRANELVSLLVTGQPHERRVFLTSSDARSVSSDSTFTGKETKSRRRREYTMKDRDWHRELAEQYQEPVPHYQEPAPLYRATRSTTPTSRYQARPRDASRHATVVILPTFRSHASPSTQRTNSFQLHKPNSASTTNLHQPGRQDGRPRDSLHKQASVSNLHLSARQDNRPRDALHKHASTTSLHQPGKHELPPPRDWSYPRCGVAEPGRSVRPGSSSEKVREPPRVPYRLAASASPQGRPEPRPSVSEHRSSVTEHHPSVTERRPSVTVSRPAVYKPRPAVETRRAADPVSDLPRISWSVMKLRERYSGGGDPATSSANKTSTSTTASASTANVKVDKTTDSKPLPSGIGSLHRLL